MSLVVRQGDADVPALRLPPALEVALKPVIESAALVGVALSRLRDLPPSKGYEPHLIDNGYDPTIARGIANLAIKSGKRQAAESKRRRPVFEAMRFLAYSERKNSILRRAKILLAAWRDTTIVETIFDKAGLHEAEFIRLLEALIVGAEIDHRRLAEIAAQVASGLSLSRGPKVTAASAAHAFLLEHNVELPRKRQPYARRDRTADNCDALTEATRQEFGLLEFDSRPARRRSKRKNQSHTS